MEEHLYHYYDESTGPFRNLSDMEPGETEQVLADLKQCGKHRSWCLFCIYWNI